MLLKRAVLDGIVAGRISLVFRRWRRPTVRTGGALRTAVGMLAIDAVIRIDEDDISEEDAAQAGYASVAALTADLAGRQAGDVYRVAVRYAGADPRDRLREEAEIDAAGLRDLAERLARLDGAAPWTRATLDLIAAHPGWRAGDLADIMGMETPRFKDKVRRLKALGLTESLETGYRLSPRGMRARALLSAQTRTGRG